jgi:hypothetical protein
VLLSRLLAVQQHTMLVAAERLALSSQDPGSILPRHLQSAVQTGQGLVPALVLLDTA